MSQVKEPGTGSKLKEHVKGAGSRDSGSKKKEHVATTGSRSKLKGACSDYR